MKKITIFLSLVVLTLAFSACGSAEAKKDAERFKELVGKYNELVTQYSDDYAFDKGEIEELNVVGEEMKQLLEKNKTSNAFANTVGETTFETLGGAIGTAMVCDGSESLKFTLDYMLSLAE